MLCRIGVIALKYHNINQIYENALSIGLKIVYRKKPM